VRPGARSSSTTLHRARRSERCGRWSWLAVGTATLPALRAVPSLYNPRLCTSHPHCLLALPLPNPHIFLSKLFDRHYGEKGALEPLVLQPVGHLVDLPQGAGVGRPHLVASPQPLEELPQRLLGLPELRRIADLSGDRESPLQRSFRLRQSSLTAVCLPLQSPPLDQIFSAGGRQGQLQARLGTLEGLHGITLGEPQLPLAMIQVLGVAPLHPLLTRRPTALDILIDLLQIELCLLQVAGNGSGRTPRAVESCPHRARPSTPPPAPVPLRRDPGGLAG
jgi:hypothetical protein